MYTLLDDSGGGEHVLLSLCFLFMERSGMDISDFTPFLYTIVETWFFHAHQS